MATSSAWQAVEQQKVTQKTAGRQSEKYGVVKLQCLPQKGVKLKHVRTNCKNYIRSGHMLALVCGIALPKGCLRLLVTSASHERRAKVDDVTNPLAWKCGASQLCEIVKLAKPFASERQSMSYKTAILATILTAQPAKCPFLHLQQSSSHGGRLKRGVHNTLYK